MLQQIAFEEPPPPRRINPAIPVELETIVLKALAKNPAERYATAKDLADDLQRFLEDRPIRRGGRRLLERAAKWRGGTGPWARRWWLSWRWPSPGSRVRRCSSREQGRTQAALDAEARARAASPKIAFTRPVARSIAQVSEEELDRPELQAVRRKLLEGTCEYYQDFIRQHSDDPTLEAELAASYFRVARILDEMGSQAQGLAAIEQAGRFRKTSSAAIRRCPSFSAGLKFDLQLFRRHEWRPAAAADAEFGSGGVRSDGGASASHRRAGGAQAATPSATAAISARKNATSRCGTWPPKKSG